MIEYNFEDNFIQTVSDFHESYGSNVTPGSMRRFRNIIYSFYRENRRDFPWRQTTDPYHILVSEIMLQQTQTERVAEKFVKFIDAFPSVIDLSTAGQKDVLASWQGLGYNRRAVMLQRAAQQIAGSHNGIVPGSIEELARLPGIGIATASAICAYAYNLPVVYIETNIRAVFIEFFFKGRRDVADAELFPLVAKALDKKNPREWYSALMDYGVAMKKLFGNPARRSSHHQKQSKFEGSNRQVRGRIITLLLESPRLTMQEISAGMEKPAERMAEIINDLIAEGIVKSDGSYYHL